MEEQGKGYITVNVRTAGGALPVSGAVVTISDMAGNAVAVIVSDISGSTEVVELPAPSKENSLTPNGGEVSSFYNVDADSQGFYHAVITGIPIFDGIPSIQQILMIPIAKGDNPLQPNDLTRFNVSELPNL